MTPQRREKLVRRCAKSFAKAEWRKFKPRAEAHVQSLMVNPETAPLLEKGSRVRFRFDEETAP